MSTGGSAFFSSDRTIVRSSLVPAFTTPFVCNFCMCKGEPFDYVQTRALGIGVTYLGGIHNTALYLCTVKSGLHVLGWQESEVWYSQSSDCLYSGGHHSSVSVCQGEYARDIWGVEACAVPADL